MVFSYAFISFTKKRNSKAKVRRKNDNDEGDAVTYTTVKASSTDPSDLYATRSQKKGSYALDQVRTQLKKIKARKATGPDGISSRLLRDCADQLCQVVCYIFNLSLSLERVPVLWKTSCVVPVPKTSRPKEPNHFRPVALT
ncbi:hypothetical protein L3Q82_001455 [Scortum barcoo]|uniref:Uncharacterized protein n=1 Tax=Scortum barcoo TaxID=214431 RepID=A0ACB8W892_9TELE|nr:hypothetical protein L3Q82_001455 [Scortum barcoo]